MNIKKIILAAFWSCVFFLLVGIIPVIGMDFLGLGGALLSVAVVVVAAFLFVMAYLNKIEFRDVE